MIPIEKLHKLRRPKLLVNAAILGQRHYSREKDLYRLTGLFSDQQNPHALETLIEIETDLNAKRKTGDASYSITRHIELLIALIAEANQPKANPS